MFTAVIRECFPTSILLGSVDNPVKITPTCSPVSLEQSTISACICSTELCNGEQASAGIDTPDKDSDEDTVISEIDITVTEVVPEVIAESTSSPVFSRVICHQCGSLFSGKNPDCAVFDPGDGGQEGFCDPGQACLWYSWQKTQDRTATVRECFDTNILLGTLENPLVAKEVCDPQDISEGGQKVEACLCLTDYCNSYRAPYDVIQDKASNKTVTTNNNKSRKVSATAPVFEPTTVIKNIEDKTKPTITKEVAENKRIIIDDSNIQKNSSSVLRCYSCGNLFNPNITCDQSSTEDELEVQTCESGEACLLYQWKKSSVETAVLRQCFPSHILLGPVYNPLPTTDHSCQLQDITDDNSGSVVACLCQSDLCNQLQHKENKEAGPTIIDNQQQREIKTKNSKPFVVIRTTQASIVSPEKSTISPESLTISPESITNVKSTKEIAESPRQGHGLKVPADEFDSLHLEEQKLECYSCGSLLFPDQQCEQFNASDPSQIEVCEDGEACLLYSWEKYNSERGD